MIIIGIHFLFIFPNRILFWLQFNAIGFFLQSYVEVPKILPKNLLKTLLTKVFPYAILIFAYDEGEDIVDKPGGK